MAALQLVLADGAGRPPLTAEITGARGASGARLNVSTPRWPVGRLLLISISPSDLYELAYRQTGFGVRDHIRVDDRAGVCLPLDSSAGPTVVAIGFGRGTRGRIQSDAGNVVIARDFGGLTGRNGAFSARCRSSPSPSAATMAARGPRSCSASVTAKPTRCAPRARRRTRPRSRRARRRCAGTRHRATRPPAQADPRGRRVDVRLGHRRRERVTRRRRRPIPRCGPRMPGKVPRSRCSGAIPAAVCGSYRLLRSAMRRTPKSRAPGLRAVATLAVPDSADPTADAALVLLGYTCYAATRDPSMLRRDFPPSPPPRAARQPAPATKRRARRWSAWRSWTMSCRA